MFCEPLIFTHLRSQQPKTYGQPWSYTNVSASYICTQKYLPKGLQNSTLFFIAHQKVLSQTKDYSNFKSWCPKVPKNHINCPTSNFLKIFRRSINGIQTRDCYKIILLGVHMWQGGHHNPCEMQDCWECTFLKHYPHVNTKWALKRFFIVALFFNCNFKIFTL